MQPSTQLGQQGEALAAAYLQQQGFTILATNYRTRRGEVDIIAQKDQVVAFVEVKTRVKKYFPISTVVTRPKQQRITLAALEFAQRFNYLNSILRFDVATIQCSPTQREITYIPNAFQAARR